MSLNLGLTLTLILTLSLTLTVLAHHTSSTYLSPPTGRCSCGLCERYFTAAATIAAENSLSALL